MQMNLDEINETIKELTKIKKELEKEDLIKNLSKLEWLVFLPDEYSEDKIFYVYLDKKNIPKDLKTFALADFMEYSIDGNFQLFFDSFLELINYIKKYNFKIDLSSLNKQISSKELDLNNLKYMRDQIKNV